MPIAGLTDRQASFPEIGQIRKGAKKTDANKPGPDLDHFRFVADTQTMRAFAESFGDKPQEIRFLSPFDTAAEVFEAWKEEYAAGGLKHRCDGQTCVTWLQPDGRYSTTPKPCPGGCKQVGRLKIIIRELNRLGFVTVHTTSIWDILTIQQNLFAIELLRGSLRGIPLILKRVKRAISTPSGTNGQRARREKWLLSIEAAPEWVERQLTAMERAALPSISEPLMLNPAAVEISPDDEYDEAEAMCDAETARAIESLWPQFGRNERNEAEPLIDYLKRRKQINTVFELPQVSAQALLEGLQKRKIQAEEAEAKKPKAASKYPCGDELARQVIDAEARLVALGEPEAGIRSEWTAHAGTLHTIETCDTPTAETWLEILKGWIASLESKR